MSNLIADKLRLETSMAQQENDLPDYLAEQIYAIAEALRPGVSISPDIELLFEQLPLYDTYGQTGYLGMGINDLILEETIKRVKKLLVIDS